jgi:hypothetical protein
MAGSFLRFNATCAGLHFICRAQKDDPEGSTLTSRGGGASAGIRAGGGAGVPISGIGVAAIFRARALLIAENCASNCWCCSAVIRDLVWATRGSALVVPHNLVRDGRLAEGSLDRGIVVPVTRARDGDGRAKVENAGSFRLGDARKRYGESRRSATVQTLRVLGPRGTGVQPR